ncbi:phage portal protein [Dyella sp. BiH032]|uniref:phage portal protein n=1 Tax=Dyella sp. BiH032 TaxID=3075430 RepID=UPI002892A539|nr:phage portal protein [Dyella sp. BiH032]WNL46562.1 phage portal protein [Dyella sp. BiH032]
MAESPNQMQAFTFGDPTPVLDGRQLLDYVESWNNGRWYETPVNMDALARVFRASPHHASAIYCKRNLLAATFVPHPLLSRQAFAQWSLDYLTFGNCYMEEQRNVLGRRMPLRPALAKWCRRSSTKEDTYVYLQPAVEPHEFDKGRVFHLLEPDINQEMYGLPEYLPAIQSALLNEAGTLFRRKYYLNGSHAGYILYMTDALADEAQIDNLRTALKESKGPGNFRNMFLYAPGGKKDGLQLMPISEVAAKDDFFNIKSITRDDVLAAHRVPPQVLGIVPTNNGGFGDVVRAGKVFFANEIAPLQARFAELNDWLGDQVVSFKPYVVDTAEGAA